MGAVTITQHGGTTIVLERNTAATIRSMPRSVNVADGRASQVIAKPNTATPIERPNNVEVGKMGLQGPPGPQGGSGATGPAGPTGAPGSGGDLHYRHVQGVPSTTWNVSHNLGKYPAASVVDSGGSAVIGQVSYPDANNCVLTFASAFSGEAFLN